jgi:hypothetical protein
MVARPMVKAQGHIVQVIGPGREDYGDIVSISTIGHHEHCIRARAALIEGYAHCLRDIVPLVSSAKRPGSQRRKLRFYGLRKISVRTTD